MSRIFSTARGLADTLKTGSWDETLLPRAFEITPERLRRAKVAQDAFEEANPHSALVDGLIMDTMLMVPPPSRSDIRAWLGF